MVRLIKPKRTTKNLTIQEYEEQKAKNKKSITPEKLPPKFINIDKRYRFLKPTQKLKELDFNVSHYLNEVKILPYSHSDKNIGSFFTDELERYRDLDVTKDYNQFYLSVYDITRNLPLVLHNLDVIVNRILDNFEKPLLRKTMLEILPSLFRDTQKDIFPIFCEKILPKLVDSLNLQNHDSIERVFLCLAYGLKYLSNEIKTNFDKFFDLYKNNFFFKTNKHIQRFSAESLSFVLKKLKANDIQLNFKIIMDPILNPMQQKDMNIYISQVVNLIFSTIKTTEGHFISKATSYLESILSIILDNLENKDMIELAINLFKKIISSYKPKTEEKDELKQKLFHNKTDLFEYILNYIIANLQTSVGNSSISTNQIQFFGKVILEAITFRQGDCLNEKMLDIIFNSIDTLLDIQNKEFEIMKQNNQFHEILSNIMVEIAAKLLKFKSEEISINEKYKHLTISLLAFEKHSRKLLNKLLVNLTTNLNENNLINQDIPDEIRIRDQYKVSYMVYDIVLSKIIASWDWNIFFKNNNNNNNNSESSIDWCNLYIFWMIHKNSNRKSKIKSNIINEIPEDVFVKLDNQFFDIVELLKNKRFSKEYFISCLTMLKCLNFLSISEENATKFRNIFIKYAKELGLLLMTNGIDKIYLNSESISPVIDGKFYPKDPILESYVLFRTELFSTIFQINIEKWNINDIFALIDSELKSYFSILANNLSYLEHISIILEIILGNPNLNNNNMITNKDKYIVKINDTYYLNNDSYSEVIERLSNNLSSEIEMIRKYSLEILTKISTQKMKLHNDKEIYSDTFALCLKIENFPATLENERDKKLYLLRLKTYTDFNRLPEKEARPFLNFLIGNFYIKFAPLWEMIKENIGSLLTYMPDILFAEIKKHLLYLDNKVMHEINTLSETSIEPQLDLQFNYEDSSIIISFQNLLDEDYFMNIEHTDYTTAYTSLFEAIGKSPKFLEKYLSEFYGSFKEFLDNTYFKEYDTLSKEIIQPVNLQNGYDKNMSIEIMDNNFMKSLVAIANESNKKHEISKNFGRIMNLKLELYLKLFNSLENLKNLAGNKEFYENLLIFLRKPNSKVQQYALNCLLKFGDESLNKYNENLKSFINHQKYKDELTTFDVSVLDEDTRKKIVPVVICLLFPKLFEKKSRNKKNYLDANRTMVFNFFSKLDPNEIKHLMDLIFHSYGFPITNMDDFSHATILRMVSTINIDKLTGFIIALKNMIDQLGKILDPYIIKIFKLICGFIHLSLILRDPGILQNQEDSKDIEIEDKSDQLDLENHLPTKLKKLYHNSLKRLCQIFKKYPLIANYNDLIYNLLHILEARIHKLYSDTGSSIPHLMKMLLVWSEDPVYIDFFLKFKFIIPDLSRTYTQPKNSKKILEVVNNILYNICSYTNLKKFDEDMDIEINIDDKELEEKCNTILKENMHDLLNDMNTYFNNQIQASKKRKWRPDPKTIKILVKLTEFIHSSDYADRFLTLFKTILDSNYINKLYRNRDKENARRTAEIAIDVINHVMKIFSHLIQFSKTQKDYYPYLLNLIMGLNTETPRHEIVNCFEKLELDQFGLTKSTIEKFKILNTYSRMSDRLLNWGVIIPICYDINTKNLKEWQFSDIELILYQYLFFLKQEELSARMAATTGLKLFLDIYESSVMNNTLDEPERKSKFIFNILLIELVKGLKLRHEYQLKSALEIIDHYILKMNSLIKIDILKTLANEEKPYLDLACLQNKTDSYQDFFANIFDIQNHMRLKALNVLNKRLNEFEKIQNGLTISSQSLKDIIFPVLRFQILEKHLQEDFLSSKQSKFQANTQFANAKMLITSLIETYTHCLKQLKWSQYFQIMKQNLMTLKKESKYEKVIVRLISSNLNELNFDLPDIVYIVTNEMQKHHNDVGINSIMKQLLQYDSTIQSNNEINDFLITDEQNGKMPIIEESNIPSEKSHIQIISENLRTKVLGPLRRHMHDMAQTNNKERKIRVYTAIAIAKLICKMPIHIFNVEFPRLIRNICESLKSRDFEIRNNARKALAEIVIITGPYFIHFIIKELKSSLILGYQRHIRNFTVHHVLKTLIIPKTGDSIPIGSIDYCLATILPIIDEEIFGDIIEEKEVEEIKNKTPEFKAAKAYDCYQMLAHILDFKKSSIFIINNVKSKLEEFSHDLKKVHKCEDIFRYLIQGFRKNESVDLELILIISFLLIEQALESMMIKEAPQLTDTTLTEYQLSPEELKKYQHHKKYLIQEGAATGRSIFKIMQADPKKSKFLIGKATATFSLNMIQMIIKMRYINMSTKDPNFALICAKFEPLTQLILNCLISNDENIIAAAMKILNIIINWPLETIKRQYKKIITSSLAILGKLTPNDIEMIKNCYSLISNVIQISNTTPFNNSQIKVLIQTIQEFMTASDECTEPLDCLNVIIYKKIVRPEVYDLIEIITENMITSYSKQIENSAKKVFLNFMIYYPVSEKIVEKYIMLFIKNLEYRGDKGRSITVETLKNLIEKLPLEVIINHVQLLFYSLVARIVNEESDKIKEELRKAVESLVNKVEHHSKANFLNIALLWLKNPKISIIECGFEGLIILIRPDFNISKNLPEIFTKLEEKSFHIKEKLHEYWQTIKEKLIEDETNAQSKLLMKLKMENSDMKKINLADLEYMLDCLLRLSKKISLNHPTQWIEKCYGGEKQLFHNLFSSLRFPKEKIVLSWLKFFSEEFIMHKGFLMNKFLHFEDIIKSLSLPLLNLFKVEFSSDEYFSELKTLIKNTMRLVDPGQNLQYLTSFYDYLSKIFKTLMRHAQKNIFKLNQMILFISEIVPNIPPLETDIESIYTIILQILVKFENLKDKTDSESTETNIAKLMNSIQKILPPDEFMKLYSSVKSKFFEAKREQKIKLKIDAVLKIKETSQKKNDTRLKKRKSLKKSGINKFKKIKRLK